MSTATLRFALLLLLFNGCAGIETQSVQWGPNGAGKPKAKLVNLGGSGCTKSKQCGACHGDCDSDADCAGALKCFQRGALEAVPGCISGGAGDKKKYDYCYEEAVQPKAVEPRWITQPSMNTSCLPGVCGKGKWALYYSGKTAEECKAICAASRTLVPEPQGLVEDVYKFRQNGHFGSQAGKPKAFSRTVKQINYRSTGGYFDSTFATHRLRDHFYIKWTGMLGIKQAGKYTFWTVSDDGSQLHLGSDRVVYNPGWHGMRWREGSRNLKVGKHPFTAEVFEGGGGAGMHLYYRGPDTGNKRIIVPESAFVSAQEGPPKLMMKDGVSAFCPAYSHQGNQCIIYTTCSSVSATATSVCEDPDFDWIGAKSSFTTCTYPEHPVGK